MLLKNYQPKYQLTSYVDIEILKQKLLILRCCGSRIILPDPDSDPALALILDSDPALALIPDSDPALVLISDPDQGFGSGLFMKNTSEFPQGSKNSPPVFELQII